MNIASLFNLAGPDLIVILLIVLLLFGAKKRAGDEFARRFNAVKSEQQNANVDPGTTFGLAAVVVALLFFLLVVGGRWTGR